MEEWKPIETAPKDGRQIRARRDGLEDIVVWHGPFSNWALGHQDAVVGWRLPDLLVHSSPAADPKSWTMPVGPVALLVTQ